MSESSPEQPEALSPNCSAPVEAVKGTAYIKIAEQPEAQKEEQKPRLEDFYDASDPRGCSTSEYNAFAAALRKWELSKNS